MKDREHIIEVANKLFMEYGIRAVSLDRIVKELRTSKRTIYKHFKDKDDLLQACLITYHTKIKTENEAIIEESPNPIVALASLYQEIVRRSHQVNPNYFNDVYHYFPEILKKAYKATAQYPQQEMLHLIEWALKDELFVPNMDREIVMRTVVYLLDLMKDNRRFPATKYSRERLTFAVIVPYLRGLCTKEGIELLEKEEALFRFND